MATEIRRPTADEATTGTWTLSSGTDKWALVDEDPASDSDFITATELSSGRARQTFTSSAPTIPTGATSISVIVRIRARKVASQAANVAGAVKVGGTYFDATGRNPTTSFADYSDTWATNPATSSAWTVDDVNGSGSNPLQAFGCSTNDATPDDVFSQCYLEIMYTPPTVTATAALTPTGASTLAGTATFSPGTKTATAALSPTGAASLSGSAQVTNPVYTAAAALTPTGAASLAASAQYSAPVYTASGALASSGAALLAAIATFGGSVAAKPLRILGGWHHIPPWRL